MRSTSAGSWRSWITSPARAPLPKRSWKTTSACRWNKRSIDQTATIRLLRYGLRRVTDFESRAGDGSADRGDIVDVGHLDHADRGGHLPEDLAGCRILD